LASRILFFELRESFLIEYPIAGGRWNRAQRCDARRRRADGERLSASHWGGSRVRALSFEFRLMRIDVAARLIVPVQVNTTQGCACLDRYAFYFSLAPRFSDATHGVEKQIARIIGRIRRRYALLTNTVIKFVFPPPVASPSFSQRPLRTLQARARVLPFASLFCDCRRTLCRAKEYLIIEKVKFHKQWKPRKRGASANEQSSHDVYLRDIIWKNEYTNSRNKIRIYKTCVRPVMTPLKLE